MEHKDYAEEAEYLEYALRFVRKLLQRLKGKQEILKSEVAEIRQNLWEEGPHIIRDMDDVIALSTGEATVNLSEGRYFDNLREIERLEKIEKTPYFARIDFTEEESQERESIYIGAVGLRNDKTYEIYVCDWRAPVSSLFYGFDTGAAWYESAGQRIEVELTLKRQILLEDGRIVGIYDTDSAMQDAILGDILSSNTDHKLKIIVNSIQKEQNTAIRNIGKAVALIYGPAGSGKTSVGLHRLAYMLYYQRHKIKSSDIVILSGNHIYLSYISGILPELCEEEVVHTVFHELLKQFLPKGILVESIYTQYKELEAIENKDRVCWIKMKYSKEMLEFIREYFTQFQFEIPDIKYKEFTILESESFQEKFNRKKYVTFQAKYDHLLEFIKKACEDFFDMHQDMILQEIEELMGDYSTENELYQQLSLFKNQFMQEAIEKVKVQNHMNGQEQLQRVMFAYAEKQGIGFEMSEKLRLDFSQGKLYYEDALLYLLVRIFLGEISPMKDIKHVLIDEAQDCNLIQLYIIKCLYPASAFTLLADTCQAVSSVTTMQDYGDFTWIFGNEIEKMPLLKSYRSSGAINSLAFQLMKKFDPKAAKEYSFFDRKGKIPQYIATQNVGQAVSETLKELRKFRLVGIITNHERDAVKLYNSLKECRDGIQLITKSPTMK